MGDAKTDEDGGGRSAGFFLCLIRSGYRVMYS